MSTGTSSSSEQLEKVIRTSASSIVVVFALVVLYSIWLGGVDYVIPVKYGLLTALFPPVYKALDDIGLMSRNPNVSPRTLRVNLYLLMFAAVGGFLLVKFSIPFLASSYSSVNLTSASDDVKLWATVGVLPPIVIAGWNILNIVQLRRGRA